VGFIIFNQTLPEWKGNDFVLGFNKQQGIDVS